MRKLGLGQLQAEWITGPRDETLLRLGPSGSEAGYRLTDLEAGLLMHWLNDYFVDRQKQYIEEQR